MTTRYPDDYPARARELRRAGKSTAQIAEVLGGLPHSTVQMWVRVLPPPVWTKRPRAKDAARAEARRLRREGLGYDEIAERLSVSKSSVSLWARDIEHPARRSEGDEARREGHRRYVATMRAAKQASREAEVAAASARLGKRAPRDLIIAGVVAYWAEGSKSKPWRRQERVTFINSDVDMIRLFLAFLQQSGVSEDRIRFRVSIHESADEYGARLFWSAVVGASADTFYRSTLKRHSVRTNRKNAGDGYHGCLIITVNRSAALYREIEGMWRAITCPGPTLEARSRIV